MDIAVYGAGKCGQYVLEEIRASGSCSYRCTLFIDNNKDYAGRSVEEIPVVNVKQFLEEKRTETVLVAVANPMVAQEMVLSLLRGGFDDIYMVPENMMDGRFSVLDREGRFPPYIKKFDDLRPFLPYVEYHVADSCNLNCKGCGHFANLVSDADFPDIEDFRKSLEGMSQKFEDVKIIRLMGGEPLLNPNLDLFVRAARRCFPYSCVSVVTNGLLLLCIGEKTVEAIRECGAIVDITHSIPPEDNSRGK